MPRLLIQSFPFRGGGALVPLAGTYPITTPMHSSCEPSRFEDLLILLRDLHLLAGFFTLASGVTLLLEESLTLDLALILEAFDQVLVLPSEFTRQISEPAEAALGLQTKDLEGLRDHHPLLAIIRVRDALKALQ